MLTLDDPNGFKNATNVYFIHLELRIALPCRIGAGKLKFVNPCLDFWYARSTYGVRKTASVTRMDVRT